MVGPGVDGNTHPFRSDAADTDSLAIAWHRLPQKVGTYRRSGFFLRFSEREQVFDRNFEVACKLQGYFGVGDVASRFDRMNGLAGHADLSRKFGSADTTLLSDRR